MHCIHERQRGSRQDHHGSTSCRRMSGAEEASVDLADAALRLAQRPTRMRHLLDGLSANTFDVVLIDTGKGLDPPAVNALAAASVPEPPKKTKT